MKAGIVASLAALTAVRGSASGGGSVAVHSVVSEGDGGLGAFGTLARGHTGDAPGSCHRPPSAADGIVGAMTSDPGAEALFFATPQDWRRWLEAHAATASEVVVGLHKRATGRPSLTWAQSVEEALCFGWIDGVRRSLGDGVYTIRFSPRRPGSHWSRVNVDLVGRLEAEGRMTDAGRAAFAARTEERTAKFAYEQRTEAVLEPQHEAMFRADRAAWAWFSAAAPYYRRTATYWVVSAKKPETRLRRLETLIECSREGRRIPQLAPPSSG